MGTIALSRIATVALVLSALSLVVRHSLFAVGPIAASIQILAVALMVWARLTFGGRSFHADANPTDGGLVTSGPYRYVRHPIYAAILFFVWAGLASHWTPLTAAAVLLASAAIAVRIRAEEQLVVRRYPEYASYAAHTKRIIPFVI